MRGARQKGDGPIELLNRLRRGQRALYANQAVGQFGHGLAGPFVPYYATRLGATTVDLGWLQAFLNLFPNLLQVPWGRLSDRVGRRIPFLVLGTVSSSSLFLAIAASMSPWQLIFLVLLQSLAVSMVGPTWSALLGERTGFAGRGRVFGRISQVAGMASLVGTLGAALVVVQAPQTTPDAFRLPFVVAAIAGIASALVLLPIREDPAPAAARGGGSLPPSPADAERHADFLYFLKSQALYSFFMSMAWPLVPITVANVLGATNVDIVVLTVIAAVSTILLQSQVGRLLDRVGPVALIQASRFLFLLVPLAYGLATDLFWIYLVSVLLGIPTAIVNIAFNAYILDLAPSGMHAEYFGKFNGAIGVATFGGTLIGGYLAHALQTLWPLPAALLAVYLISCLGRGIGAVLSLRIRDPTRYPETIDDVLRGLEQSISNGRR